MALELFKAPPLPLPPDIYNREYVQQLVRVLGIYFSQLDSFTPNIASSYRADNFYGGLFSGEGYGIKFPHIAASDSTSQYAGGNNTPTVVNWDTLDAGYLWTLNAPGSATADVDGIYTIRYSLEFANTANGIHDAIVWLRVNGTTDVPNSATYFSIPSRKSAGIPSYVCAYSEITFTVNAGDSIELMWATDLAYNTVGPVDGVYIRALPAQTVPYAHPAVPSAVGSITFLSALP